MAAKVTFSVQNGVLTIVIGFANQQGGSPGPAVVGPIVFDPQTIGGTIRGGTPPEPSSWAGAPPEPSSWAGAPPEPSSWAGAPPDPSIWAGAVPSSGYSNGNGGPVVIGPLIFGPGGYSSAATVQPSARRSRAVAVNPPQGEQNSSNVSFKMEDQEEPRWCWSAVAVSIHNFRNPKHARDWNQEKLATPVLLSEGQIPSGIDCSKSPELCDFGAALNDALTRTGNLAVHGVLSDQHLVFNSLKKWIDAGLPVAARIQWHTGGAHFIAIDGYLEGDAAEPIVHVQDPYYGPSLQLYSELVTNYPPGGVWQDTYLVH